MTRFWPRHTSVRERERELTWTWNEAYDGENMYEKDRSGGSNNVSQSPLQCIHAWAWLFCRPHSYKHSIIPVLKIKREQTTLMLMLFHHRSPEYILVYLEQFTWSLFLHIHLSWAATCAGVSLSERVLIILCWWYRHIQPIFLVKTNYDDTVFDPKDLKLLWVLVLLSGNLHKGRVLRNTLKGFINNFESFYAFLGCIFENMVAFIFRRNDHLDRKNKQRVVHIK